MRDKKYKNRLTRRQQFWHIFDVSDLRDQLKEVSVYVHSSRVQMVTGSPAQHGAIKEDGDAAKGEKDVEQTPMVPPSSQPPPIVV